MADSKKCKHAPCDCMAREGSDYCSEFCADAKNTTSLSCDCPHSGCAGKL